MTTPTVGAVQLRREAGDYSAKRGTRAKRPARKRHACRQGKSGRRRGRRPAFCGDDAVAQVVQKVADASHRSKGLWAVDTCNPNSWKGVRKHLELSFADACSFQEVRRRPGEEVREAEAAARRVLWSLAIEPRADTDEGYRSAGVGVAVRSHVGMAQPPIVNVHPKLAHRVVVKWVNSFMKGFFF